MSKICPSLVLLALLAFRSSLQPVQASDATTQVEIVFEGNQVFTTDQLRSAMTPSGTALQATLRSNPTEEVDRGLRRLREFLTDEGYATPRIGKPQREWGLTSLVFRVHLEEGPLYRLGEVKVTGATVFAETQIIEALDIRQGDPFRGKAVRIWFDRLKEMYANAGYHDWTPVPRQEVKEPDSASSDGTVNLTIDMDEGPRL